MQWGVGLTDTQTDAEGQTVDADVIASNSNAKIVPNNVFIQNCVQIANQFSAEVQRSND